MDEQEYELLLKENLSKPRDVEEMEAINRIKALLEEAMGEEALQW